MTMVVNFLMFQIAWFACVLGAANGMPWLGPLCVAGVVVFHLGRSASAGREAGLLVAAAVLGAIVDSALVATGWLSYPNGQWFAWAAPYWIVAMWVAFATTLNVSLGWLKGRALLAITLGAIGGPLAYLAGQKLGGVTFIAHWPAVTALAVIWGAAMPLLMKIAERLDGWGRTTPASPAETPRMEVGRV